MTLVRSGTKKDSVILKKSILQWRIYKRAFGRLEHFVKLNTLYFLGDQLMETEIFSHFAPRSNANIFSLLQ